MHWKDKSQYEFFKSLEKSEQMAADYIVGLVSTIGDRTAIVDACISPRLVNELRGRGLNAIWVPNVLGDGASDEEIERTLLSKGHRVLLTKDVKFYKRMAGGAILLHHFTDILLCGKRRRVHNRSYRPSSLPRMN